MLNRSLFVILCIFFLVIILPVLALRGLYFFEKEERDPIMLKVYNVNLKKVEKMELEDYLVGVVAAEMPAIYHIEALKSQAVAARTYAVRQMPVYGGSGSRYDMADICTDFRYSQAWISEEEMKEKWGFVPYFYLWNRVKQAVEDTAGEILIYEDRPIEALYHSNAGGRTESAQYVWGNRVEYLKSVASPYDREREKNYKFKSIFEIEDFDQKLGTDIKTSVMAGNEGGEMSLKQKKPSLFEIMEYSESGRVYKIKIGDKILKGNEIRDKLSLQSNYFEFHLEGDEIHCSVKGYGHGVGMSQDGADGFARHGYDYKRILKHFYPGTELIKIKDYVFKK